jgi:catechol 2,3-dioxygenase-like lactoylglutathione lyase family enzyme
MPLKTLVGLDHVVVVVRDLAEAARRWEGLGFTVSPRGTHSAHMGTGNHTLMLGEDYLELLGVLAPTERNAPTRALLEKREGIERAAFTTSDAAAGVAELQARGIAASGPIGFSRPVDLPDGSKTEARFDTFLWPLDERPGGMRIFACQHYTREAVWLPHLQRHANTAERIVRVELLAADPRAAAADMSRLIGQPVEAEDDLSWRVPSGGGRGDFVFLSRAQLEARHPGVSLAGLPADGAVALVLKVRDVKAAARATAAAGSIETARGVSVPPAAANGVLLVFVA